MINIAIADDEKLFIDLLNDFFDHSDNIKCCFTALSGEEMITKLNEASTIPDLVLLDLKMKEMDGADTATLLKSNYPHLKTIVMSSHYEQAYIGYMLRAGVNAFIPKGISPKLLIEIINSVNEKGYYFMEGQLESMRAQIKSKVPQPKFSITQKLTDREIEIIRLICKQHTAQEIADTLFISKRTVEGHKESIFMKTRAKNIAGLVIIAIQNGIVETDIIYQY